MRIKLDYARGSENYEPGNNTFFSEELQQNHAWIDLDIIYENYLPLTRGLKLGLRARGHFSNRSFFTNYYSTLLNAADYHPIPHSKSLFLKHFIGNHFVGLTLTPLYEFNDKIHLRASFSTFIPYQSIEASVTKEPMYSKPLRNYYKMGSASVVYQTIFGPTSLSVNYYDKESKKWYFLFNFGFILFNEPGLK
jgi:NTE family protein